MMKKDTKGYTFEEIMQDDSRPAFPLPFSFNEELPKIWGKKWGAQSEIGKMKEVLCQRPGPQIAPKDRALPWYAIRRPIDAEKATQESINFTDILEREGVKVHYGMAPDNVMGPYVHLQRIWATRDPGFVVNGGAIVNRMSLPFRRGDEFWWTKKIAELGCPILYTVHGNGTFESGNVVWLDPQHICIGRSLRTNQDGIDQVSYILSRVGVEEIEVVDIPGFYKLIQWPSGGFAHLDCVFCYVDDGVGAIYPPGVPFSFLEYLLSYEINLIEVPPSEGQGFATNVVALEPGKIVMLEGFPETQKGLESAGVDCITVNMDNFILSGGGPHCASAPLIREPGPKLGTRNI